MAGIEPAGHGVAALRIAHHTGGRADRNLVVVHEYDRCGCHRLCTLAEEGGEIVVAASGDWCGPLDVARLRVLGWGRFEATTDSLGERVWQVREVRDLPHLPVGTIVHLQGREAAAASADDVDDLPEPAADLRVHVALTVEEALALADCAEAGAKGAPDPEIRNLAFDAVRHVRAEAARARRKAAASDDGGLGREGNRPEPAGN
jgi:hypothetical protein